MGIIFCVDPLSEISGPKGFHRDAGPECGIHLTAIVTVSAISADRHTPPWEMSPKGT
jgi:hypothetical protein